MIDVWRLAAAGAAGISAGALAAGGLGWLRQLRTRGHGVFGPKGAGLARWSRHLRDRLAGIINPGDGIRGDDLELVLLMLAAELEVGTSWPAALTKAAQHAPPSLAQELRRIGIRAVHGDDIAALQEWAVRQHEPLLVDLAATIQIQRETGGSIAPVLRGLAGINRSRRLLQAQGRSKTAEARISAWVLALAPIAIALYAASARPGFLAPLWEETYGRLALAYGVVSWLAGVIWIQRLLKGIGGKER